MQERKKERESGIKIRTDRERGHKSNPTLINQQQKHSTPSKTADFSFPPRMMPVKLLQLHYIELYSSPKMLFNWILLCWIPKIGKKSCANCFPINNLLQVNAPYLSTNSCRAFPMANLLKSKSLFDVPKMIVNLGFP